MMKRFTCVEQSTDTIVVCGEVKIPMMLLNTSVIHRSVCVARFEKVTGPFFFEEPTMTADTFLGTLENAELSQPDASPRHFSRHVRAFLDRRGVPIA
jgi:hypothetical protein